jgi:hypothetical protein
MQDLWIRDLSAFSNPHRNYRNTHATNFIMATEPKILPKKGERNMLIASALPYVNNVPQKLINLPDTRKLAVDRLLTSAGLMNTALRQAVSLRSYG